MDSRDALPPRLRHGVDQTVAAQRLEGWRPGPEHIDMLADLAGGTRTFTDCLVEHRSRHPPPRPPRRSLRRKRPYLIPGSTVLRNNFGTDSAEVLADLEFIATAGRTVQWHRLIADGAVEVARVDIRAVHRHLFADVYPWAGELRSTELRRGETVFARQADLVTAVCRLEATACALPEELADGDTARLAYEFARWYAEYNGVHPFREGNGRTGTLLLHTLAELCGHRMDLGGITRGQWYAASRDSMPFRRGGEPNHRPFLPLFGRALAPAD